jgi:hypothetical protein
LSLCLCYSGASFADQDGLSTDPIPNTPDPVNTVTATYTSDPSSAAVATGGVGLRNKKGGIINISGLTGGVKAAYLYWAYIVDATSTPAMTQSTSFCSISTTSAGIGNICIGTVTGTRIAVGRDPCWLSSPGKIVVYRADVKNTVGTTTSGNGSFSIGLPSSNYTNSSSNGRSPWVTPSFPAAEGASLVVVGAGNQTVQIFDKKTAEVGITGRTFNNSTLTYTLSLNSGFTALTWHNIGADGQIGTNSSVVSLPQATKEKVFLNSVQVSGPGSDLNDSDWDGSSSWPLPQLWDDTAHTITGPGNTNSLLVAQQSFGDCVTPIANVVAFTPAP